MEKEKGKKGQGETRTGWLGSDPFFFALRGNETMLCRTEMLINMK